jgi:hypothetical protein
VILTTRERFGSLVFPGVHVGCLPSAIYCYWTAKELLGVKSKMFSELLGDLEKSTPTQERSFKA